MTVSKILQGHHVYQPVWFGLSHIREVWFKLKTASVKNDHIINFTLVYLKAYLALKLVCADCVSH